MPNLRIFLGNAEIILLTHIMWSQLNGPLDVEAARIANAVTRVYLAYPTNTSVSLRDGAYILAMHEENIDELTRELIFGEEHETDY